MLPVWGNRFKGGRGLLLVRFCKYAGNGVPAQVFLLLILYHFHFGSAIEGS